MDNNVTLADLKNIRSYKTKKLISVLKKLTDEQINLIIDSSMIDYISRLDKDTINSIFRNSNANMQNKLWTSDRIQRILIYGTPNPTKCNSSEQTIRNIENLSKVIKSSSIKKQIYNNIHFINVIINSNSIENRFFFSYDLRKTFEGVIQSKEYNSLDIGRQLRIIEKLNSYTGELLLPPDFRSKYKNIERILLLSSRDKIDECIMSQLNREELFFLDYTNDSTDNNNAIKNYILENLKTLGKSFEEFFEEIKRRDELFKGKVRDGYRRKYYCGRVTLEEKVYHILLNEIEDEIIKEKLLKYLICLIIKDSKVNPELMYETLKRNLNNKQLSYRDICKLKYNLDVETKDLKLIFYLKFNIALSNARYLFGITADQLSKINVKHINKLAKFLEDKTQDELSSIYGLCIKMYFIFGYERSIEILSNKFGEYNKVFLDNVGKTNVSKVKMKQEGSKYLPEIDQRFINFMFQNPKNNHFINMLNDKNSDLYNSWYYVYNNYDTILERCHNEITLKKVMMILETDKYDVDRKIIPPDNYLLNGNSLLGNIVLGNKSHKSNNDVLTTVNKIYTKMKKRVEASIPYVKGKIEKAYSYEMMKLDDPQIFELGYKANCCIRTHDVAHNHLLHAALCRNGRVLIIYDKLGDVAAFCPLKRNGNVLIVNSIECVEKENEKNNSHIVETFEEAIRNIVEVSKQSNEPISLVCIGSKSYLKPKVEPFPNSRYETPTIFEKQDEVYRHTDSYHKTVDIVYKDSKFSFENIKSKDPDVSYMDPREEVKSFDCTANRLSDNIENVINVINGINYSVNKEDYSPVSKYSIRKVYYSKDWYIAETFQGLIGECLDTDYRAREEYNTYMDMLTQKEGQKVLKIEM